MGVGGMSGRAEEEEEDDDEETEEEEDDAGGKEEDPSVSSGSAADGVIADADRGVVAVVAYSRLRPVLVLKLALSYLLERL